ncbi:MAG: hypothetical protein LBS84_01350, partial [Clostridiales bacterium]|nr:hypothetical protein [Clostridiales bacterium]
MNQPQAELAVKNASKKRGKSSKDNNIKMRRLSKKQAVLELQPSESVDELIQALESDPLIESAQEDFIITDVFSSSVSPSGISAAS